MRRSLILDVCTQAIARSALVLAVYLLAAGHNQPGGGFIGGLVAGAAVALTYLTGGLDQVRALTRFAPWTILGTGLAIVALAALAPIVLGGAVLGQDDVTYHLALLGKVKITSALFFDTGVFLAVLGTVLMAFEALGEDDAPADQAPREQTLPGTATEEPRR